MVLKTSLVGGGFCRFKRRKKTSWPIVLFNYNQPPDVRFHLENILCVRDSRSRQVKDIDSFLVPLVEKLKKLAAGVSSVRLLESRPCKIAKADNLGLEYFKKTSAVEIADVKYIEGIVGRVWDRKQWVIVEREGVPRQVWAVLRFRKHQHTQTLPFREGRQPRSTFSCSSHN